MKINSTDSLTLSISQTQRNLGRSMERIASGKRINSASDDAAGLAMAMSIETQTRGLQRMIAARQDEISLVQTAEGAMATAHDALQRIGELAVQASNGTMTDSDRGAIQQEIVQLRQHLDMNAGNAQYNTKRLLDGSFSMKLQNSQDLSIRDFSSAGLGVAEIDVSTADGASAALASIDGAIQMVSSSRADLGAVENGVAAEAEALQRQMISALEAGSRIADADMAREIIEMNREMIKAQLEIRVFRVDNERRGTVLELLG